jgi:hypothetical protein
MTLTCEPIAKINDPGKNVTDNGSQTLRRFNGISRRVLGFWKNSIVKIGDHETTSTAIADLNERLLMGNAITFFDHHYAFDALPVGLVLGQVIKNAIGALIPYAVHLDMGVDPEGLPSLRYRLRTLAF